MTGPLGGRVTFVTGERLLSGTRSADDEWWLLARYRTGPVPTLVYSPFNLELSAEFLARYPPRSQVQKNIPTRIAAMQPHCSHTIRSRSTRAAKASVTSG